jgi:hypothetical protein
LATRYTAHYTAVQSVKKETHAVSAFTNTAGDCPCFERHTLVQGEATQSPCVLEVSTHFTRELFSCIVLLSLIAPDYEPFSGGTASEHSGGATVLPLKGFFHGNLQ